VDPGNFRVLDGFSEALSSEYFAAFSPLGLIMLLRAQSWFIISMMSCRTVSDDIANPMPSDSRTMAVAMPQHALDSSSTDHQSYPGSKEPSSE